MSDVEELDAVHIDTSATSSTQQSQQPSAAGWLIEPSFNLGARGRLALLTRFAITSLQSGTCSTSDSVPCGAIVMSSPSQAQLLSAKRQTAGSGGVYHLLEAMVPSTKLGPVTAKLLVFEQPSNTHLLLFQADVGTGGTRGVPALSGPQQLSATEFHSYAKEPATGGGGDPLVEQQRCVQRRGCYRR